MKSDIDIARSAKLSPIIKIASKIGIKKEELELFGNFKAKIDLGILKRLKGKKKGKYVVVTAITPTPLGEGKTVTTIGLSMALNKIGQRTSVCIRQPSLGPVFGIKGGAAGGGYSQVIPMEDFNLHLTGDVHAVGLAHNLCAAFLYNALLRGNKLNIDHQRIYWRHVVDVSHRFLRNIKVGLGTDKDGFPCDSGFDITVASEIMAILALSSGLQDLRKRISRILLADTHDGLPVTPQDIKVTGAMTALLKHAIRPNLIQTLDNTPCFVHAGPFGNIAHGNSSILADEIALALSEFVVTEAGFGADLGFEKFANIKCRYSGLKPDCAVMVVSIRALKAHSGRFRIVAGKPLDPCIMKEDLDALQAGLCNLEKQIENVRIFGIPVVVAVNRFNSDSPAEIALVTKRAREFGADDCQLSEVFSKGSKGGVDLAEAVVKAANKKSSFKFLYPLDIPIKDKIKAIATKIYGARDVEYSEVADQKIKIYTERGWDKLPICMAKTHLSLSHDPNLKGRPENFVLPVRDIRASVGAGFLYPLCGTMQTMPGLPGRPVGENIDIDKKGEIIGLS